MLDTFPPDWMPLLLSPLLDLLYILRRNSHHIWMPELWEWDMNVGDTFQEIASIIIFYGIICKYFEIKKVFNLSCSSFLLCLVSFSAFQKVSQYDLLTFYLFQLKRMWMESSSSRSEVLMITIFMNLHFIILVVYGKCVRLPCFILLKRTLFSNSANLSIVLFSLELCGIRLICASSLRFTEGFCMEWIKYEQNWFLLFDITFGLISLEHVNEQTKKTKDQNFPFIFPKQLWHLSIVIPYGVLRTLPWSNACTKSGRYYPPILKSGSLQTRFIYWIVDDKIYKAYFSINLFAMRQKLFSLYQLFPLNYGGCLGGLQEISPDRQARDRRRGQAWRERQRRRGSRCPRPPCSDCPRRKRVFPPDPWRLLRPLEKLTGRLWRPSLSNYKLFRPFPCSTTWRKITGPAMVIPNEDNPSCAMIPHSKDPVQMILHGSSWKTLTVVPHHLLKTFGCVLPTTRRAEWGSLPLLTNHYMLFGDRQLRTAF